MGTTLFPILGLLPRGSTTYILRNILGWVPPSPKSPYFENWSYVPVWYYPAPPLHGPGVRSIRSIRNLGLVCWAAIVEVPVGPAAQFSWLTDCMLGSRP